MHLPIPHTCKTSQRTLSFQAEVAMVLQEKSSLLLSHRNNRASKAFLNVASFQNFLKRVWKYAVHLCPAFHQFKHICQNSWSRQRKIVLPLSHDHHPSWHWHTNDPSPDQCLWLLHISTLAPSPPLLKQIWDANKESLCQTLYIYQTLKKKEIEFESKYVAKCNLMQWNCFEYSNGYLLKTS